MQLSNYQQQILDFIISGTGNGACNAVAGSGKSTTLRIVAQELEKQGLSPSQIRVIVFGKANSLDLINKFGNAWKSSISTLHSAGWGLIKEHLSIKNSYNLIKSYKYKKIAEELDLIGYRGNQYTGTLKREGAIKKDDDFIKLCDFLRLTNSQPTSEAVRELCGHFNLEDIFNYETCAIAAKAVLNNGERLAKLGESFDFTDQIWLPVKWGLKPNRPFKFVLCDEAQDLNAAQLELTLNLAAGDGRLLFVGDPRQAIMGFAGADNESYSKIVKRTNATELPLSVCYRCPTSHIKLVKKLYPLIPIEPFENAVLGEIKQIKSNEIHDHLKVGDLVLSRKTAPLVSLCIKLIAKGIAATVRGKAIGEQIKKDLESIGNLVGFTCDNFNDYLTLYKKSKAERYKGLDNEERLIEDLNDKCEALTTIYKSQVNCNSIAELGEYIDGLFSDDHSPITLSTAHRAKGLENDRVFLIKPEDFPLSWKNQKGWEHEQECNLHYVALTRAKSELIIVGNCSWYDKDDEEPETIDDDKLSPLEQLKTDIREYFKSNLLKDTAKQPGMLDKCVEKTIETATGTDGRDDIEWRLEKYFSPVHREAVRKFAHRYCDIIDQQWKEFDDKYQSGDPDDDEYRDWAGLPRRKPIIDETKTAVNEAIATSETPQTIETSLTSTSIDANCYQSQFSQFELGLKVGLSIPLEQELSNKEKRERAIAAIKGNPELSARAIADSIGVSNYFVSKLKRQLINDGEMLPTQVMDKRGRKINTDNIGINKKSSVEAKIIKMIVDENLGKDEIERLIKMLKMYL